MKPSTFFNLVFLTLIACGGWTSARGASPLSARGYAAVPEPRTVALRGSDFRFGSAWRMELGQTVAPDDIAVRTLTESLNERFRVKLAGAPAGSGVLRLEIVPRSVAINSALDSDRDALAEQAYRINLNNSRITITANAPTGLFYGVETLVQLLKPAGGELWLPEGEIVDWPDLRMREIYWDDAHHLDTMEELKRAVRQAAFFKINGFVIKLEGHFQFHSAPAIVEPYALSPAQFQELTDFGLRYHVQVIPYLDGPAHIAFILKHPEYAKLREYPESNYEMCVANPDAYKMLFGLLDDLMAANKGVHYFYLSTDEPYYVGLANNQQCQEAAEAQKLGGVGKLLAQFVTKAAGHLHDRGREVVFWGEYPLKLQDLDALPRYIINGEVYGPAFDRRYRDLGIRQMIYTAIEGEEKLFPDYFALPANRRLHPVRAGGPGRVVEAFQKIAADSARENANLMGAIVAGWGDMGLHPETFWLGYATATSAAWNPNVADPRELMSSFYALYFGHDTVEMARVYQLLSFQAQFWSDSWDSIVSTARKPIFGNSYRVFTPPQPVKDQTLPLPPLPSAENLSIPSTWAGENAKRIELASEFAADNDELAGLLYENMRRVPNNRYALEVFAAINSLCRQNLDTIEGLSRINSRLLAASKAKDAKAAVQALDGALDAAVQIQTERNQVLKEATATWYKTWHPRVAAANGRTFFHELDDVKDHLPDRTIDMSYLVYRELQLPMQEWVDKLAAVRNQFAASHQLPSRDVRFAWNRL